MSLNRRSIITGFAALALATLGSGLAFAQHEDHHPAAAPDKAAAPATPAQQDFELIKKLAGDWTGEGTMGEEANDMKINYRVTAGGSAVIETLFGGSEHEMITMYHMDGDSLVLTHYCALGNQPTMKAVPVKVEPGKPTTLKFEFSGGTNINPKTDMHMHNATITITDDDHISSVWTMYNEGKAMDDAKFTLTRKK